MRKKKFIKWVKKALDERDLNTYAVYVFVRKDIPIFAQAVQTGHACLGAGELFHDLFPENTPHLVLLRVENEWELGQANRVARASDARTFMFYEPDSESLGGKDPGFTAFATEPLPKERWTEIFEDFELWNVQ